MSVLPELDLRKLPPEELSLAESVALLPEAEREAFLGKIGRQATDALIYDWEFWARPEQRIEFDETWSITVLRAGRSAGKTRPASEAVRKFVREHPRNYLGRPTRVAFVAPNPADARDVMIGGTDGIQTISPPSECPDYVVSNKRLTWPNGVYATVYSGAERDDTRGATVELAWVDELRKFKYPDESFSNLRLAMRGGKHPYTLISTTPGPFKVMKDLFDGFYPNTNIRQYTTLRNLANVPTTFINEVLATLWGTRLGRIEIMAEMLEDVEGALLNLDDFDKGRIEREDVPPFVRFGVACDPSGSAAGDEVGIVAGGLGADGVVYITHDRSDQMGSEKWSKVLVDMYNGDLGHQWPHVRCDWILGEDNWGGDMIPTMLHLRDPLVNYVSTHASDGKRIRAEPVAGLYRTNAYRPKPRVRHVGLLPGLESQWSEWVPPGNENASRFSPGRIDAVVMLVHKLLINSIFGSVGFHDPSEDYVPTEDLFALPHVSELT